MLTNAQRKQLEQALLSAFPTRGDLSRVCRFHLDQNLEAIAGNANLVEMVEALVRWAESRESDGRQLSALVSGAREENNGNSYLRVAAQVLQDAGVVHL